MKKTRPHDISIAVVESAFERVRRKKGGPGVDGETVEEFAKDAENKLYKIWNRMSSGSYFPKPVRMVEIPKPGSEETRKLGIPTVTDRIAQAVVAMYVEEIVEPKFHKDSYSYRKEKGMREALAATRQRCWKYDWVIDLDIKGFFDNIDHELMLQAVREHTDSKWQLMYIERWLKAPEELANGKVEARERGTPQGAVISPLLANIYLHHAFDEWMKEEFPSIPFARYADDIVIHCKSEAQAKYVLAKIKKQMQAWKLELHPEKTRIVYCKDGKRPGNYPNTEFTFLGYTFKQRRAKSKGGKEFMGFLPAISKKAAKRLRGDMHEWGIQRRTDRSLEELAEQCNKQIRGWCNHYGMFYPSRLKGVLQPINVSLAKWVRRTFKKNSKKAWTMLRRLCEQKPKLFAHWEFGVRVV